MRRGIAAVLILSLSFISLVGCKDENDGSTHESISFLDSSDIYFHSLYESADGWVSVNCDRPLAKDGIAFVSENENVAKITCNYTVLEGHASFTVTAVGEGETYIYAKTDNAVSQKIKISVAYPDDGIINEEPSNLVTSLKLIYISSPIEGGDDAILRLQGQTNTLYKIKVYYTSSASNAEGLEDKMSDSCGFVEWKWKIGTDIAAGKYKISVASSNEKAYYYFIVK